MDQQPLHEASPLRVLGLEVDASGSAEPWVKKAKQQSAETMQLIRRIAKKSGGARTDMARLLIRSVLQPQLVYGAQFQHFTKTKWARLETINHEAICAITGLPRLTPLPTLQAESQLNTLHELVHQRRCARAFKPSKLGSAAALARYIGHEIDNPASMTPGVAPWNRVQLNVPTPAHAVGTAALVSFTNPFKFCWCCSCRVKKTVSVCVCELRHECVMRFVHGNSRSVRLQTGTMGRCCVLNCRGNYDNGPKVRVFSFPKDDRRAKWERAVRRDDSDNRSLREPKGKFKNEKNREHQGITELPPSAR
ncbi:hypothetical protein HPB49_023707 [Dermacentor silvarum]|uniref:Uncharacterized protein n=1 Tax=Dermacentor silvarum TaxID=543639 RepID=A0ACB8C5V4_DERSI|nr:hypothetical protein HPB49_023707 [Dermacentor silvarum]